MTTARFRLLAANSSQGIAPYLLFGRSGGSSTGNNTAVGSNHLIGEIAFCPADSTNMGSAAVRIQGWADGTVGENDIPGRLIIQTVPDGSETAIERFRLSFMVANLQYQACLQRNNHRRAVLFM